jgi:hypothetical protein
LAARAAHQQGEGEPVTDLLWRFASDVRDALARFPVDEPPPDTAMRVACELLAGSPFESWASTSDPPSTRELRVALGQLAAAGPHGGTITALKNLADDCRSPKDAECPGRIVHVYLALAATVSPHGPSPTLRRRVRTTTLLRPSLADVAFLADVARSLITTDDWTAVEHGQRAV